MKNIWKEYTASLQAKKEYIHIIQTKNVNTVFIRNFNISKIKAGTKPNIYETIINTNQVGIITRPFRLDYIYLFPEKTTHVNIIETKMENIDNFIRRKIKKNIIIQNTPNICIRPTHERIIVPFFCEWIRLPNDFIYVLDLGEYGRPNINIYNTSHIWDSWFQEYWVEDNVLYIFGSHDTLLIIY